MTAMACTQGDGSYPLDSLFHTALFCVFQGNLWLILPDTQCAGKKLETPLTDTNQKYTIVQSVSVICN